MRSLAVLWILGCGSPAIGVPDDARAAPPRSPPPDAGLVVAATPIAWQWDTAPDLYPLVDRAVEHTGHRYVVSLTPGKQDDRDRPVVLRGGTWSVEVAKSGQVGGAAVAADDARVYVATYNRISAGCALAAFSVTTGKPLWAVTLDGIGPIGHSKYSNRVQLRLVHGHPVVFGNEAKRYIEERDAATGALRSHQLLDPLWVAPPIGEPLYRELDHMLAAKPSYTVRVNDFLARHVLMKDADHAARGAAFGDAVRQLDGLLLHRGTHKLRLQLVETSGDFEVRAQRSSP
ncbi:MAG: hypothetical protein H6Q90_7204 [Deltaproteobacteria bacterium]|nr:hypothetical protein [Deltaproteobacteria bacterium]